MIEAKPKLIKAKQKLIEACEAPDAPYAVIRRMVDEVAEMSSALHAGWLWEVWGSTEATSEDEHAAMYQRIVKIMKESRPTQRCHHRTMCNQQLCHHCAVTLPSLCSATRRSA